MAKETAVIKSYNPKTGQGIISLAPDSMTMPKGTVEFNIKEATWRLGSDPVVGMKVDLDVSDGQVVGIYAARG